MDKSSLYVWVLFFLFSCKKETEPPQVVPQAKEITVKKTPKRKTILDTLFVNVSELDTTLVLDIRYATKNNILYEAVYDCEACYLAPPTAQALVKAQADFLNQGYRIKLLDCYRPLAIQQKLWEKQSGTSYVANPKKGSNHNRGAAVDVTLVDSLGNELDMGTPFDFFGPEAHHNFINVSSTVHKNRKLLKNTMLKYGFTPINSE